MDEYKHIMRKRNTTYPVEYFVKSKFISYCLQKLPVFRGHTLFLTSLFKITPASKKAYMRLSNSFFLMDLSYSTHVSCLRVGEYEKVETFLLANTLSKGDRFLDIGANWGYFTAIASHCVGLEGVVYSVEANPQTFERLSRMLRNSGASNVLPFNFAVCNEDAKLIKFVKPWLGSDAFGHISNNAINWKTQNVLSTTLDTLWERVGKPCFKIAKIDVEGMEPMVLAGGRACLSEGVSDYVIIEINEWTQERCGHPYEVCYELLSEYGFPHIYQPTETNYEKISLANRPFPHDKTLLFARSPLPEK